MVHGHHFLREHDWVALRHDQDPGADPDAGGRAGGDRRSEERVVRPRPLAEPGTAVRGVGIARRILPEEHDMLGELQRMEARLLDVACGVAQVAHGAPGSAVDGAMTPNFIRLPISRPNWCKEVVVVYPS